MITETQARPREPWPWRLKFALAVLIAVGGTGVGMLAFVLFASDGTPSSSNGLTISSDDPLAVAEFDSGSSPLIGDHWHASYVIFIGNDQQPNAPTWEGVGIHTHGDGIIHMHPFQDFETGEGAALNKWFEYGGGELTDTSMRLPGQQQTIRNGDAVPGDGRPGQDIRDGQRATRAAGIHPSRWRSSSHLLCNRGGDARKFPATNAYSLRRRDRDAGDYRGWAVTIGADASSCTASSIARRSSICVFPPFRSISARMRRA